MIICSDAITALKTITTPITLAYLDPPFATGKKQRGSAGEYADPGNLHDCVDAIVEVATAAYHLLSPAGCIVIHIDSKTSHYVKVALDEVFGSNHFASEIIWRYRRWPSKQANFQRYHDVLLRYVRTPGESTWNQLYEPLAASSPRKKQKAVFLDGVRHNSLTDEDSPGCSIGDVWDIPIVAPTAKERTGYPTQKPQALLERLILALTNPGDTILDPYLGSGTSLVVAARLHRLCIGIDRNPQAIEVARKRLAQLDLV